jgi:predicted transglutaminase-like cysteine proteinase
MPVFMFCLLRAMVLATVCGGLLGNTAFAEYRSPQPASLHGANLFLSAPAQAGTQKLATKWETLAPRIAADRQMMARCRRDSETCPPAARRFLEIIEGAGARDGRARLAEVNRAINLAITYVSDFVQHGTNDLWSSPLETFNTLRGDCEDYAIAKYVALLESGVSPSDLVITLVEDSRYLGSHMVLAARVEHRWLVLDSRNHALLDSHDLPHHKVAQQFSQASRGDLMLHERADMFRASMATPYGSMHSSQNQAGRTVGLLSPVATANWQMVWGVSDHVGDAETAENSGLSQVAALGGPIRN